jgi:hypothetical protein
MHPLVAEAMKKAAVAWLGVDDLPLYAVWCLWVDDALYVVSGEHEQPAPGLAGAKAVAVSARGDHGGRIVTWRASAERVTPESEQWASVAPQLAAKRLNSLATDDLVQRWAESATITRLSPTGELDELPDGSLAAPPPPSPATNATRKPFRLHKVRGRR